MSKQEIINLAILSHNPDIFKNYDFSLLEDNIDYKKHQKIDIICLKHDIIFHPEVRRFIDGSNCNGCANELRIINNRKDEYKDNFINKAKLIHKDRYNYNLVNYINAKVPVNIICGKCGRVFKQTPNDHLNGKGCSFCRMSKLELEVGDLLEENNISFIYQCNSSYFKWLNKLSLDFYLPDYNVAIECQGRQHFESVKSFGGDKEYINVINRDINKNKLCLENGIRLIYYSHFNNKEEYRFDLIRDKDNLIEEINKIS